MFTAASVPAEAVPHVAVLPDGSRVDIPPAARTAPLDEVPEPALPAAPDGPTTPAPLGRRRRRPQRRQGRLGQRRRLGPQRRGVRLAGARAGRAAAARAAARDGAAAGGAARAAEPARGQLRRRRAARRGRRLQRPPRPAGQGAGRVAALAHRRRPGGTAPLRRDTPAKSPQGGQHERPFATPERQALRDTVRRFVTGDVLPHLPQWEREGELPRSLSRRAAELGLLGHLLPRGRRRRGRRRDRLARPGRGVPLRRRLQRRVRVAVHHRHRAAAPDRQRRRAPHRDLRPPHAGRGADRLAGHHRAGRRVRRRRAAHHGQRATATSTSSTAPRPTSPPPCAATSSSPRSAPATRRPRHLAAGRRQGHAGLHGVAQAGEDGLALLRHRRAGLRRRPRAGREPGRRGELRVRADRAELRLRTDRAGGAGLRLRAALPRPHRRSGAATATPSAGR